MNDIPQKLMRKILNLFLFNQIEIIKYPTIEYFVAAQCNTNKIICCAEELEEMSQYVETGRFPIKKIKRENNNNINNNHNNNNNSNNNMNNNNNNNSCNTIPLNNTSSCHQSFHSYHHIIKPSWSISL